MSTAFIICGPPGAGKTTYGSRLAAERQAVLLDIDTVTETMVRAALSAAGRDPNDRDSPWFKTHFREPIYDTLFAIAKENLPVQDVVIVGPFTREIRDATWPGKLVERLGSPVKIHYVTCPPEVRRQRIITRGEPRDLAKLADWDSHQAYFRNEGPPVFEHVFIDTGC
ncbi:MAG: putative kinase [Cellvibrionaceae bacterium]|jgi:predicted kinase